MTLTDQDATTIASICHRVDGMPFAIELAAARVTLLALPQIEAMLENRLGFLSGGDRVTPARQPTMRAMIEWSHNLLSDRERTLLRRLSVFAGGFTLEAAQGVAGGRGLESFDVLDLLAALVDKSLVELEPRGASNRYRLLEATRQYAAERLAEAGEDEATNAVHLAWYLARAEQAEVGLTGPQQSETLDELEAEHDNLLVAVATGRAAGTGDDLRLAAALSQFWLVRGLLSEGRDRLDDALGVHAEPDPLRLKGLWAAGMLACFAGDFDAAAGVGTEASRLARKLDSRRWEGRAATVLGLVASGRGQPLEAQRLQEEALACGREANDEWLVGFAETNLGNVLALLGRAADARTQYEAGLALRRRRGDAFGVSWTAFRLGVLATWDGHPVEAATLLEEARDRAASIGYRQGELLANLGLAELALSLGDLDEASSRCHESLARARELEETTGACVALAGLAELAVADGNADDAERWLGEPEALEADLSLATLAALLASRAAIAAARGDDDRAEALRREALAIRVELGDHRAMLEGLEALAVVAARRGRLERARVLLAAATGQRKRMGLPLPPRAESEVAAARQAIAAKALAETLDEDGSALTLPGVIELALIDGPGR
jgi:tetratricopeptide (TPR) repeat protein